VIEDDFRENANPWRDIMLDLKTRGGNGEIRKQNNKPKNPLIGFALAME
jgi:hypothetical protein